MRRLVKPGLATMSLKVKLLPDCILQTCLMWLHCVLGAFFLLISVAAQYLKTTESCHKVRHPRCVRNIN